MKGSSIICLTDTVNHDLLTTLNCKWKLNFYWARFETVYSICMEVHREIGVLQFRAPNAAMSIPAFRTRSWLWMRCKTGASSCCWAGEAVWLTIPMSFYKLLFLHIWNNVKKPNWQSYIWGLYWKPSCSSCYRHVVVPVIVSRCCSTIPGSLHRELPAWCCHSHSSPPPDSPLGQNRVCVSRGIHPPVNSVLLLVIKIKLMFITADF